MRINLARRVAFRTTSSSTSHKINATLYPRLPFDPVTDFTPISMIATVPSLLVGNPALPAQDLAVSVARRLKLPLKDQSNKKARHAACAPPQ
jgi:tripartite-type tricarboxylate transporter receptor subunit TctC